MADTLSQDPLLCNSEEDNEPGIAVAIWTSCNWYNRKLEEVEKISDAFPDYQIDSGQLYRHFWNLSDSTELKLSTSWKKCVPKNERPAAVTAYHDNPTVGHPRIARTATRIALKYCWAGPIRYIANYVRKCECCQRYKGSCCLTDNMRPWETVSVDLVGPLPRSTKRNNY